MQYITLIKSFKNNLLKKFYLFIMFNIFINFIYEK